MAMLHSFLMRSRCMYTCGYIWRGCIFSCAPHVERMRKYIHAIYPHVYIHLERMRKECSIAIRDSVIHVTWILCAPSPHSRMRKQTPHVERVDMYTCERMRKVFSCMTIATLDSVILVTRLIHTCDMAHSYV